MIRNAFLDPTGAKRLYCMTICQRASAGGIKARIEHNAEIDQKRVVWRFPTGHTGAGPYRDDARTALYDGCQMLKV